jgi:hypothetical protein
MGCAVWIHLPSLGMKYQTRSTHAVGGGVSGSITRNDLYAIERKDDDVNCCLNMYNDKGSIA